MRMQISNEQKYSGIQWILWLQDENDIIQKKREDQPDPASHGTRSVQPVIGSGWQNLSWDRADTAGYGIGHLFSDIQPGNAESRRKERVVKKRCLKGYAVAAGITVFMLLAAGNLQNSRYYAAEQEAEATKEELQEREEPAAQLQEMEEHYEEQFFEKPEDAAWYFAEAVREQNYEKAISAFAVKSKAEGFDYAARARSLNAIVPGGGVPDYDAYEYLNEQQFRYDAARQCQTFALSMLYQANGLDLKVYDTVSLSSENGPKLEEVMAAADPAQLSDLRMVRMDFFSLPGDLNRTLRTVMRNASYYGADLTVDYVCLYELKGTYYSGGFSFLHYPQGWQIRALNSVLAGQTAAGEVEITTMADYLSEYLR